MRHREDYRAAGVPMLPAVATEPRRQGDSRLCTWLTAFAAAFARARHRLAIRCGRAARRGLARRAARQLYARVPRGHPVEPLRLFKRSNTFLAFVFCALAIDSALALPNLLGH